MSDQSSTSYPPPPPTGLPPPIYQGQPDIPAPAYQPPAAYPSQWSPGQPVQPYAAPAAVAGTSTWLLYQFGGPAAGALVIGVLGIMLPFITGYYLNSTYYFRILPIFGIISGFRAIMRGRVIGGAVGIGLNVLAGIVSLMAAGILGGR